MTDEERQQETATGGPVSNETPEETKDTTGDVKSESGAPEAEEKRQTDVLYTPGADAVFIVTDQQSADAVIASGGLALAAGGKVEALTERITEQRPDAVLVLAFDHTDDGKKDHNALFRSMRKLNVTTAKMIYPDIYTSPADNYDKDPEGFAAIISKVIERSAPKADSTLTYLDTYYFSDIESFSTSRILTGFDQLDAESGGMYPGLYALAGIPSLGKSSFALQLADQVAAAGHDVLFFALEMSRLEMVTKSFSRITATNDLETAATSLSIRKGYRPTSVVAAMDQYRETVGDRLSIIEGNFNCDIQFITEYTERYIRRNHTRPVVVIDYLQLLQPAETNGRTQTTKETVDTSCTELKRMSRELSIPVLAISSVNRANYTTPISYESLKESGSIEFTSDVIWGLQLHCVSTFSDTAGITEKREKVNEAKRELPRKVDLVCLKNRFGVSSYTCYYEYDQSHDKFTEYTPEEAVQPTAARKKARK